MCYSFYVDLLNDCWRQRTWCSVWLKSLNIFLTWSLLIGLIFFKCATYSSWIFSAFKATTMYRDFMLRKDLIKNHQLLPLPQELVYNRVSKVFNLADKDEVGFNSLRPSDAILRHRIGSNLAQVMVCCLTAPSHYLNQCWLIITKVQWCSSEGNFAWDMRVISH